MVFSMVGIFLVLLGNCFRVSDTESLYHSESTEGKKGKKRKKEKQKK